MCDGEELARSNTWCYNAPMKEIELKAHVLDREKTRQTIETFACFQRSLLKEDTYYEMAGKEGVRLRIRRETQDDKTTYLATYKKSEAFRKGHSGETEVNEEAECTLSSPDVLISFLRDTGFNVVLQKRKETLSWKKDTDLVIDGVRLFATLELCCVPPLGDFIEIEILSPSDEPSCVEAIQKELLHLLEKCGVSSSCIERQYYSDLLAQQKLQAAPAT